MIPRDNQSETIRDTILDTLNSKATHLDNWATDHKKMFRSEHSIPPSYKIHLSKLKGGLINTDTCNGARLLAQLLVDAVDFAVEENRQLTGDDTNNDNTITCMVQDCHNHMRNIWIKAVTHCLSAFLNELLAENLTDVDWRLGVMTMFDAILRAV
jgi:hypothetical protein